MRSWPRRCLYRRLGNFPSFSVLGFASLMSFFLLVFVGAFFKNHSEDHGFPSPRLREHIGASSVSVVNMDNETKVIEKEMARRRQVILDVCEQEKLGIFAPKRRSLARVKHPPSPNFEAFFFDRKHKLSWCPIYKAASTSWLYNYLILAGYDENYLKQQNQHISRVVRKLYPPLEFEAGSKAMNESIVKFFIVRHPFERILSAYRDKLENRTASVLHGTLFFYKKFGKSIVEKYRKENILPNTREKNKLANRNSKITKTQEEKDSPATGPGDQVRLEPTFEEFVRYLVDTNLVTRGDEHWIPYYAYCTPCWIQYDVIAKFETLERDQNFVIKKAQLDHIIKPTWKHLTKGQKSANVLKKYFSTISKELLIKLYHKYKIDFDMFEYDIQEYLKYVK